MKSVYRTTACIAALIAAGTAGRTAIAQTPTLVYANTNTLTAQFAIGSLEVGNQITLGPGPRTITQFSFEYFLPSATGSETADLRFYANDSINTDIGFNDPGTVLYDSGVFNIGLGGSQSSATIDFEQANLNGGVNVPNTFTFTVQFGGLAGSETIGVDLYNPITVGSAPHDAWENLPGGWELVTNNSFALTIGAEAEATPEPSSLSLLVLGGFACGIGFMVRRAKTA